MNQPSNDVHAGEIFPEINFAQSNSVNVQVNQNVAAQVNKLFPEINVAQEHGLTEQVNQQVGGSEPCLFWEKKIIRSLKGGNQVLVLSYRNYDSKKCI